MKIWNSHIIMEKGTEWKDLEDLWEDVLRLFFQHSRQFSDEPEVIDVIIEENLVDLKHNRKPEGFNRDGKMRIVVPLTNRCEFYIYRGVYSDEIRVVTEKISSFLARNGIRHRVEWNDMLLYEMKKRRR